MLKFRIENLKLKKGNLLFVKNNKSELFKKLKEVGWNVNDVNVSEVNIVNEFKGSDGARNKRGKQFAVRAGRVY
jgi:hypothetical protein